MRLPCLLLAAGLTAACYESPLPVGPIDGACATGTPVPPAGTR